MRLGIGLLLVWFGLGLGDIQSEEVSVEPVQISFASATENPVWVGQRVTVVVEVLSETFFSGATSFSLPEISGAIFYQPESRAVVGSKTIASKAYSVQRHEFSFYPRRAGEFIIPPFEVRFGVAGLPGQPAVARVAMTEPLQLAAAMPPSGEHLLTLISTTDLTVTESWTPQPGQAAKVSVGDAFKRRIVFRAADMPGMVFPVVEFPDMAGLGIYPSRGTINDTFNRGDLTGERIDEVSYVCESPGDYTLPEITIPWWDLDAKEMKAIVLPGVVFHVQPSSAALSLDAGKHSGAGWRAILWSAALVLGFAVVILLMRNKIGQKYKAWNTHRHQREIVIFRQIFKAKSAAATLKAVSVWIERIQPSEATVTLDDFALLHQDEVLQQQFEALQQAVVCPHSLWDQAALCRALKLTRRKLLDQQGHRNQRALPRLNPGLS